MAPLFASSCPEFTEDDSNSHSNMCEDYDFIDWVSCQKPRHENPMCTSLCKVEANASSSFVQCKMEICSGSDANFQQDCLCITNPVPESHEKVDSGTSFHIATLTESATGTGALHQPGLFETCNTTNIPIENVSKHGVKRKSTFLVTDKIYLPVKRVSPFLNTPKEKKEERKKILKLTVKKLNLVSDPDRFLRKTVVMHNTMKKIQRELKEEKKVKRRTRKDKRINSDQANGEILANSSLSLFDDLFLYDVLEKTPEYNHDLSNSLINYSLEDKLCDTTDGCVATCSSTKQSALAEFSSSLPVDSYELKPCTENETTCTHLSRNAISIERNEQSSQMDSNNKMDINPCEYQLSNIECPDICFDGVHSATTISDRGFTLHDKVPSSSHITAVNSNSVSTYQMDSMESELISAISHLEAIACDSGNSDNFDISHSVDYLTAAHSFFSPSVVLDPSHSNSSLIFKEVEMCI